MITVPEMEEEEEGGGRGRKGEEEKQKREKWENQVCRVATGCHILVLFFYRLLLLPGSGVQRLKRQQLTTSTGQLCNV